MKEPTKEEVRELRKLYKDLTFIQNKIKKIQKVFAEIDERFYKKEA